MLTGPLITDQGHIKSLLSKITLAKVEADVDYPIHLSRLTKRMSFALKTQKNCGEILATISTSRCLEVA